MKQRKQQTSYPYRHLLVAVLGQTPQIITETLYALMVKNRAPVPISEIFIITTSIGAERARRDLLHPQTGQFFAFCHEYGFDPKAIAFDAQHIITIKKLGMRGSGLGIGRRPRTPSPEFRTPSRKPQSPSPELRVPELDDIRTVGDNRLLAEQLFGIIKQLTDDPQTALHCSIAGGRKTMSAYMALALTLYGREQDRLYHVLVPEKFERNPQFFFPPRRNQLIGIGVGQVADTREARIELADIPFVRLRAWLKERGLQRTIEGQIRIVQRELNRQAEQWEPLIIDYQMKQARLGERVLPLTGVKLAFFAYFAERRANHAHHREGKADRRRCPDCFQSYSELDHDRYGALYVQFARSRESAKERWQALQQKGKGLLDLDLFLSYCSKLNRVLKDEGFPAELQIQNIAGTPRNARYGLRLDPARIEVVTD